VLDLQALAALAHERGALLAVDSTLTSPYLARPLEDGADLVVHSATKYIGGRGGLPGGAVPGRRASLRRGGGTGRGLAGRVAALEAWLMLRGLKTLTLRMERHCANALGLAQFLNTHAGVERVYYPGLLEHPQHALAVERYHGCGGVLSFEVPGGRAGAFRVL